MVKNHFHAVKNPKAQLRYKITVEQALAALMVVDPFGLYNCTPQSDGAAAVILAAEDVVDRYTDRPVWVRGVGLGMDRVMPTQGRHDHVPADRACREGRDADRRYDSRAISMSPRCTTVSRASS